MRQQALVPAGQEDGVEFESLGAMQRHQIDAVRRLIGLGIHHQAHMLEEAREGVELLHEADQLLQVLQLRLGLRRSLRLPHLRVAGLIQDQFCKLGVAHGVDQRPPAVERGDQVRKRFPRLRLQLLGLDDQPRRLHQRRAPRPGELMQRLQARLAQAPARHVDDALEFEVVRRIERDFEIGGGVPDLLPLVEARTADDAIGKAERDEAVFEGAHLERGADQNRDLAQGVALALQLFDILADDPRFLLVVPTALHLDLVARAGIGAERLAEPALVVGDQAGGGAKDMRVER